MLRQIYQTRWPVTNFGLPMRILGAITVTKLKSIISIRRYVTL